MKVWKLSSLIFLIWAITATAISANYYQLSQNQENIIKNLQAIISETSLKVNIAISYGNGTIVWYNNTYFPIGASLFNATQKLCKIEYIKYPFGIYITSINNVAEDPSTGKYWIWYTWSLNKWEMGPVGADQYILKNGDILKWELTKF